MAIFRRDDSDLFADLSFGSLKRLAYLHVANSNCVAQKRMNELNCKLQIARRDGADIVSGSIAYKMSVERLTKITSRH